MGEPGAGLGLEPGLEVPGGDLDLEAGGQRPPHCRAPREAKPRARSPLSAGRGAPFSPCSSAAHARPGTGEPLCHSRAPSEAAPPHRGHPGPAPGAHHRGPTHARLHGHVADCGTQLENCYSGAKRIKGTKYSGAGNEEDAPSPSGAGGGPPEGQLGTQAAWGREAGTALPTRAGRCPEHQAPAARTKQPGECRQPTTGGRPRAPLGWAASPPPTCPVGRLPSPFSTVPEPWSPFPVTARKGPLLRRGNSTVPRPPLLPDGPTRCPSPGQHGVPLRGSGPLPTFLGRTSPRPPLGGGPFASEHRNPSLSPVLFVAAPLSLA